MGFALHHTTGTTRAAARYGFDRLGDHVLLPAVAMIVASQPAANATIHNADAACSTSPPPRETWAELLPVAGIGGGLIALP